MAWASSKKAMIAHELSTTNSVSVLRACTPKKIAGVLTSTSEVSRADQVSKWTLIQRKVSNTSAKTATAMGRRAERSSSPTS